MSLDLYRKQTLPVQNNPLGGHVPLISILKKNQQLLNCLIMHLDSLLNPDAVTTLTPAYVNFHCIRYGVDKNDPELQVRL